MASCDLLEASRRPFLKFAASSDRLLYGSTIYADANASVALEWLGGLRFMLGFGVRTVLSLEDAATNATHATKTSTHSHHHNDNTLFQHQRHGLQPPTSNQLKHTAVFFITSQVWNCEDQILAILTDARTRNEGAFDRALICCSVSEAAHACSSPRPDVWHETTFKYSRYKRNFKTKLIEGLQQHVPPSCLISIRHFPLAVNVVLDSRIKGRGAHAHMGETKCLGLFTLTHERSRRIFPTTPSRLSTNHRLSTGGSLTRMTINHLPPAARSALKVAAHQLSDALLLLGLDVTGKGGGYGIGEKVFFIFFEIKYLTVTDFFLFLFLE